MLETLATVTTICAAVAAIVILLTGPDWARRYVAAILAALTIVGIFVVVLALAA